MSYFLEIEAEHHPRHVGPFPSKAAANTWARERIRTGSWSVSPMERP